LATVSAAGWENTAGATAVRAGASSCAGSASTGCGALNVSAAGFAASCRRELRVDLRTLTYYTRLRNGFALLERALRTRSGTLARRAERRINALREPDSRSAEQQRLAFQSACGPPSAYP
jgi:hypothetical protein